MVTKGSECLSDRRQLDCRVNYDMYFSSVRKVISSARTVFAEPSSQILLFAKARIARQEAGINHIVTQIPLGYLVNIAEFFPIIETRYSVLEISLRRNTLRAS